MSGDAQCDEIRVLLPELALGIADGEDRSRALEHAATCADCRRELESLSTVADELLELAPAAEPPAGFETRVLGALHPDRRRARRTFRRPFAFAAVALAAAAITAGITVRALEGDRSLADHYAPFSRRPTEATSLPHGFVMRPEPRAERCSSTRGRRRGS